MGEEAERWTIVMGNYFQFSIEKVRPSGNGVFGSDADLNGSFPTKLAALGAYISAQEETRESLALNIARAKRMRSRLRKDTNNG